MSQPSAGFGIHAANVTKTYRHGNSTHVALDDLSLTVRPGEIVAMAGPSGSGKSTLLDILLGWQEADTGSIEVSAEDRSGSVGVVTQDLALLDELTTQENLWLATRLPRQNSAAHLIELLELDELGDRMTSELSLGQQQRVAIARALIARPNIVIADEPTSHQDAQRATQVMRAFRAAANGGAAVLLTSHDPRIVELCDRELRIEHGRVNGGDPVGERVVAAQLPNAQTSVESPRLMRMPPGSVALATAVLLTVIASVVLALT